MKFIGIKQADGSFYPILEDGKPSSNSLVLTTARNNQTAVNVDLYRSDNDSIDSEYVTSDKLIGKYVKTFNFLNIGKLASNKNLIYSILIVFFIIIMVSEGVNIYLIKNKKKLKDSNKVSNDELKEQLLMEMKEELLKEIEEEEKNTKEDS